MALSTTFTNLTAEQMLFMARISETAERWQDMAYFGSLLVKLRFKNSQELNIEERNLLSVAYKNIIGSIRSSWRTLNFNIDPNTNNININLLKKYQNIIENKIKINCEKILKLLNENLLIQYKDKKNESHVFYLKMAADYNRYLAEIFQSNNIYKINSENMYNKSLLIAKQCLSETHPTRLGLSLNASVCYYEILKKPNKACMLAKDAFDGAINKLDTLNDASYKDSTLIMQLLRDNLNLWTNELNDKDNNDNDNDNDNDD